MQMPNAPNHIGGKMRLRRGFLDLLQDIRYAIRSFRQRPGFVVIALLTLALGTGATTVMFSVVSGVLLKPLPYPQPNRLVAVNGYTDTWNAKVYGEQNVAYLDFLDCQHESRSLDMAAAVFNGGTLSGTPEPEYVDLLEVSHELFSVLRVPIALGRDFSPEDDRLGASGVLILGHTFWQKRFGGRAEVLGTSVVVDQKQYTIIGVAPKGFRIYGDEPDVYTPVGQDNAGYLRNRAAHPAHVIGRLRPGATLRRAQAELATTGHHLAEEFADTNAGRSFKVNALRPQVGDVRFTLWLLLGAVSLVLLIACANVASLMLARAVSRERELAMRAALGASRSRLVRQCLTESSLLGLSGAALGVLLAANGIQEFLSFWPGDLPRAEEVQLDWRVLLFATGLAFLSSVLFGLAPALRAPFRDVEPILRSGARTLAGTSRRVHSGFVISEIAVAIVLLVAAGMLGRTLLYTSSLNPGLDIHNLLVTRMALSPAILGDAAKIPAAWEDVLDRARRVPGVVSASTVEIVPMREGTNQLGYWPSPDMPPTNRRPFALASSATPEYLKVMGIPLLAGRFFDDHDRLGSQPVIVIDEVLAKSAFGAADAIGRKLWVSEMPCAPVDKAFAECQGPYTIVGVVGHVRYWGLAGDDRAPVRAQLYYPFAQVAPPYLRRWSELMSIAVRTDVPPLSVLASLRQALRGAGGDQVLYEVHTMEQLARDSLAKQRFLLFLFAIFAGLALVLACIGIYGVLAYLTGQRVPEMAIRMALGAEARDVIWLVLRHSLGMIALGVVIGGAVAVAAGRILESSVEGMQPESLASFAATIPVLVLSGLFASFLPARRASRVDPLVALKYE
jgi:predicted permease